MKLLLVNPRFPESFWSFRWAVQEILPARKALNPPLGLATLAALCPPHWDVEIVDENVEALPLAPDADLIGICGMGVQHPRQRELLQYYRARGYRVVAGGSYASLCPEKYADLADAVIAGEAERIWPQFCADFERDAPRGLYRETGEIGLDESPTPRFDLLPLHLYSSATLQFSRGCPYRCDFCDIIVMFGRKPRCKSPEQIGRELDLLRAAGVRQVFFVDDNLIGHRPAAKELLRFLRRYQDEHGYRFSFGTEASLNLAQDEELLRLFREANFGWVFIGIETPDADSLKETRKTQNTGADILGSVQRIHAEGIEVLGGFIVGFDNDTLETFERQYAFITNSGIQAAMVGLLTALPRTPLYLRLEREGRLRPQEDDTDNTRPGTNIVPRRMGYDAMVDAYQTLYRRLLSDRSIAARIRNKLRHLRHPVGASPYPTRDRVRIVWRLLRKGIFPGGPVRIAYFLRTLPWRSPQRFPVVVADWITGLAMREYVDRRFGRRKDGARLERRVASVRAALRVHLSLGAVEMHWASATHHLSLRVTRLLEPDFFRRAAPRLARLLAHTRSRITLHFDDLHASHALDFERLLARLARNGDRVYVVLDERLRSLVRVDSSIFNLVLKPRA